MNVTAAVLDDYKTLVRQHGVSDDDIIMNQDKGDTKSLKHELHFLTNVVYMKNINPPLHLTVSPGDCSPSEQMTEPITTEPKVGASHSDVLKWYLHTDLNH